MNTHFNNTHVFDKIRGNTHYYYDFLISSLRMSSINISPINISYLLSVLFNAELAIENNKGMYNYIYFADGIDIYIHTERGGNE